MKPLLDCYSLIRSFSFKQKVLIMHVGGIKLKAILRRFTFFIKEIQNKKHFVKRTFTDIKSSSTLIVHRISSYLFIVLIKKTRDE